MVIILSCIFFSTLNAQVKRTTNTPRRANTTQPKRTHAPRKSTKSTTRKRFVINPAKAPSIQLNIDRLSEGEDWGWVHEEKQATKAIKGKIAKKNVYYFKSIKKNSFLGLASDYNHTIVTDTLYAPISILNTDSNPRRDEKSQIRIIADHIVQENPIKLASVRQRHVSDYIFSTNGITYVQTDTASNKTKSITTERFAQIDGNIKVFTSFFRNGEQILINRLYVEIMEKIATDLLSESDLWKKDKLLTEFQIYRKLKVKPDALTDDKEYQKRFTAVCATINSEFANQRTESNRKIGDLNVLIQGDIDQLHLSSFKYYALPTIAVLTPTMNDSTGINDQLGSCLFKTSGVTDLKISLEVILGYDDNKFAQADQLLKEKGLSLEKNPPRSLLFFENQTLKVNGKILGEMIPISNQIFHLEITLPDEQLSLIKLFPQNNSTTFDLIGKMDTSIQEFNQKVALHVPNELLKSLDYEHIIKKFNVIESNALTDHVKISSQLSPVLEDEGALQFIEVSLKFSFDDRDVYKGPFRLSSYSTLSSEKYVSFIKYSENYKIGITGTAYYEDEHWDIKNEHVVDSKFIVLEENMFKKQ